MEKNDPDAPKNIHPSVEAIENEIAAMESQLDDLVELEITNEEIAGEGEDDSSYPDSRAMVAGRISQTGIESTSGSDSDDLPSHPSNDARQVDPGTRSLVLSTLLSLTVVLVLLGVIRLALPQMLEWCRYSWTRGQLRAEYEISGQMLNKVSMDGLSQISQLIEKRINPSVVHIDVRQVSESQVGNDKPKTFDKIMDWDNLRIEQGSGVIIDEEGHILTNHHVVEGEGKIEVTLNDGRAVSAKIIGVDPETDLALLKIDAPQILSIAWGDSDEMAVGMPVWAVGSPFGLSGSVTFGILSGKHRVDLSSTRLQGSVKSQAEYSDLMQSDVAVNPGNSGGPLVNAQGELIGINTAIIGESFRGVSFSIPSNVARRVVEKLLSTGKMERGILGIVIDDTYRPKRDGVGKVGIRVRDFSSAQSPARLAGILLGDIIVRVGGKEVESLQDLRRIVGESYVGDTVDVVVWRDQSEIAIEIKVIPNPNMNR